MKLSEQGVLTIEGTLVEQDDVLFALSESGDLIVNEFIEVDNTSELLIELGGGSFILHGELIEPEDEVEPEPEPIPSLVAFEDRLLSHATVIVDNAELLEVETIWNGAGLIWEVNLEPNQMYRWTVDIEITRLPNSDTDIRGGIYNVSSDAYMTYDIFESSPTLNVRQHLTGTFNTGSISPSHTLELELVEDSSNDGAAFRFKIYKDSFKFVKE